MSGENAATSAQADRLVPPEATSRAEASGESNADLLAESEQLIEQLSAHPDPAVGIAATALLERIDIIHRTALAHLMGAIQSMGGEAFINRLTADPAIRLLLMSYDLLAVDRRTLAEEALDPVRGHLHSHGIDVELLEVLGGVVAVRIHGAMAGDATFEKAAQDIEKALRIGLLGFQELEIRDGRKARPVTADSAFLPLSSLQRAFRPVYRDICRVEEVVDGAVRTVVVDGTGILLARDGADIFAVRNACGESPLPLDYSMLKGTELRCSWHGCRYDVRTGRRLDRPDAASDEHLQVFPVRVHEGMVQIAVATARVATTPVASPA